MFNIATDVIFKSEYPITNLCFIEVYQIKQFLNEAIAKNNLSFIKNIVMAMKDKFDKCWRQSHLVMSLADILDPKCKIVGVNIFFQISSLLNEAKKHRDGAKRL